MLCLRVQIELWLTLDIILVDILLATFYLNVDVITMQSWTIMVPVSWVGFIAGFHLFIVTNVVLCIILVFYFVYRVDDNRFFYLYLYFAVLNLSLLLKVAPVIVKIC